jgi:hypothetical protein
VAGGAGVSELLAEALKLKTAGRTPQFNFVKQVRVTGLPTNPNPA